MSHIFISYARKDSEFAKILNDRLKDNGFTVWMDTAIRAGEHWREEIDQSIKEASALIVIMTPDAKDSQYVAYEWAFAWGAGVKVVPIMLIETELHPRLGPLQYLNFTRHNARPWDRLIKDLSELRNSKLKEAQPGYQVHRYSGLWEVENRFSRWRDRELGANDTVYWHGRTFLLLSADGQNGMGTQTGKLYVSIGNYKATYEIGNQINRADVTDDGTLHVYPEVLSRVRIEEEGEPPEARFREALFGSGEYDIELEPVAGVSKRLEGKHRYKMGNKVYQEAEEYWTYVGS